LINGKIPHEDLVIIRELGANYKSESYFMKVFSDQLKKAGKIVNPGDRLDFLIIDDPSATLLGHKMRLTEQYLASQQTSTPLKIDYNYYIEKALLNPINQLFAVGFKETIMKLQNVLYKPTGRSKPIFLDRPVNMIIALREKGYDLRVLKDAVRYNVEKLKAAPVETKPEIKITPLVNNVNININVPSAVPINKLNIIPSAHLPTPLSTPLPTLASSPLPTLAHPPPLPTPSLAPSPIIPPMNNKISIKLPGLVMPPMVTKSLAKSASAIIPPVSPPILQPKKLTLTIIPK
jgi:hypothetical protein